ncbi:MAG: S41 family peptidase [Muribaculum sp.]|nr:S41 family peptidase [Muribaculum sp.]
MKHLRIVFLFCAICSLCVSAQYFPEYTNQQNLEDFEYALNQLENSYSGFDIYVNDTNRTEYDSLVSSLRNDIITTNRPGWDASNELYSWFDDAHLGLVLPYVLATKYSSERRKFHDYGIDPYEPALMANEVNQETYLIRIPEFDNEIVTPEWVDSIIYVFDNGKYSNLIIDLRGNSGGDERLWHPLLAVIYEHNGTVKSVEFKKSDDNVAFLKAIAEEFPEAQMILDKIADNPTWTYIPLTDTDDYQIEVLPYSGHKPEHVAFVIDGNVASAAEGFLLQAKAVSDNVIIYGRDNTSGTVDCASVRDNSTLPNSGISISIPTTRTCGLPQTGIDRTGIAPDRTITINYPTSLTDNIDEWVKFITYDMAN